MPGPDVSPTPANGPASTGEHLDRPTVRIGTTVGPYEGWVDPDAVAAFALATNDPNPACREGAAVPPLFSVSLILGSFADCEAASVDPGAIVGERGRVHAEHDLFFHAPLSLETAVRWTISCHALHQTPAGILFTQRFLITDTEDRPLVEHLWSTLRLGATSAALGGPALPEHRYPMPARDRILGTERFELARDQTYRYAGVSGDRAPHALDDQAARREGFPSKILPGTCTLAMAGSAAVKWGSGGDPLALRRLVARFSAPAFPKRSLEVQLAEVPPPSKGSSRVLAFEARQGGTVCLRHGRAEFAGGSPGPG